MRTNRIIQKVTKKKLQKYILNLYCNSNFNNKSPTSFHLPLVRRKFSERFFIYALIILRIMLQLTTREKKICTSICWCFIYRIIYQRKIYVSLNRKRSAFESISLETSVEATFVEIRYRLWDSSPQLESSLETPTHKYRISNSSELETPFRFRYRSNESHSLSYYSFLLITDDSRIFKFLFLSST